MKELSSLNPNASDSYVRIMACLLDGKYKTWDEIFKASGLSRGYFSKLFRELVKCGYIKGEIFVEGNKLVAKYRKTDKNALIFCYGETEEVVRIAILKRDGKRIKGEIKIIKEGVYRKRYGKKFIRSVERDV